MRGVPLIWIFEMMVELLLVLAVMVLSVVLPGSCKGRAAVQVLELPSVLAYPLFSKLVVPAASVVQRDAVESWLHKHTVLQVGHGLSGCPQGAVMQPGTGCR